MSNTKHRKNRGCGKKALFKYQCNPSITNIKDIMKSKNISSFTFQLITIDNMKDIIKTLNPLMHNVPKMVRHTLNAATFLKCV